MTIQRVTPETEIKPGMWMNKEPIMRDAICGYARLVVKAPGQRVYFTNRHGEDEGEYCARKSVLFVSDTKEEAETIHALSSAQMDELSLTAREVKAKYHRLIDKAIVESRYVLG